MKLRPYGPADPVWAKITEEAGSGVTRAELHHFGDVYVGYARRHPDDAHDPKFARRLALRRALRYFEARPPLIVRPGVVETPTSELGRLFWTALWKQERPALTRHTITDTGVHILRGSRAAVARAARLLIMKRAGGQIAAGHSSCSPELYVSGPAVELLEKHFRVLDDASLVGRLMTGMAASEPPAPTVAPDPTGGLL